MPVVIYWGLAALLAGGGAGIALHEGANAAQEAGTAAEKSTALAEVIVAGLAIVYGFKVAKGAGWIK